MTCRTSGWVSMSSSSEVNCPPNSSEWVKLAVNPMNSPDNVHSMSQCATPALSG